MVETAGISVKGGGKIVMGKVTETLIQYARADFFQRMHLFLQFPDLRGAFQEIERKDLAAQRASPSSMKQHSRGKCSQLLSFTSRIVKTKIRKKRGQPASIPHPSIFEKGKA